jgi:hypothetical protein
MPKFSLPFVQGILCDRSGEVGYIFSTLAKVYIEVFGLDIVPIKIFILGFIFPKPLCIKHYRQTKQCQQNN